MELFSCYIYFQLEHDQHPSVEEILDVRASFNKFPFSVEDLPTVYYVSLSVLVINEQSH